MRNWYDDNDMALGRILAEDAGAPELRNPMNGGLRGKSLIKRLVESIF